MSVKQFAADMKATIEGIKANGTAAIYCDNIIAYLDEVQNSPEPEPTPIEIERYKAKFQIWVNENKSRHAGEIEMFRSVITAGQGAIKSSFLLNGGASFAMLAFIGHLAQFNTPMVPVFAKCLILFAFGVLAVAVTSGSTYLSQWFYGQSLGWTKKTGFLLNILCIVLGIVSYGMFTWGMFKSYFAFIEYVKPVIAPTLP